MVRLLLVDPRARRRDELAERLSADGFAVLVREAPPEPATGALKGVDCVLLALSADAPEVVASLQAVDPVVPVVVYGASLPDAALAARLGRARTYDCLAYTGRADLPRLRRRLDSALRRRAARSTDSQVAAEILGVSDKIQQLRRYVASAAGSTANVLITGESGTGKELVARAIHAHGDREKGPFLAVNCAAIPDQLLESDLFGHEKGAFTGAVQRARGRFEQADGGTLLFDEVGEMPAALQAKLLRVLQPPPGQSETTREFTPVGAEQSVRADVRLVFATNRDLRAEVEAGRFREDLYQRLDVLRIHVPALRERREDVPQLAQHFLQRHAAIEGVEGLAFDPLVVGVLQDHDFPRNVRELEGLVRSVVALKEAGGTVVLGDLPPELFGGREAGRRDTENGSARALRSLADVEAEHVGRVMEHVGGNKSRAARILGVSRPTLDRKLAKIDAAEEASGGLG